MSNLGAADILNYASAAGFAGGDLATAVAIALAESSGNPNAYNPEPSKNTPHAPPQSTPPDWSPARSQIAR